MKKISFLLCVLHFMLNCITAQGPLQSVPPFYIDGSSYIDLPIPTGYSSNPSTWNDTHTNDNVYDGRPSKYAHNIGYYPDGSLAFFIVDNFIYDSEGYEIYNFVQAPALSSTNHVGFLETMIVPNPENCHQYYIFYIYSNNSGITDGNGKWQLAHCVLDLSETRTNADNYLTRIGNISVEPTPLAPSGLVPGNFHAGAIHMGATARNNNNERFVFFSNGSSLFEYRIDGSGLTLINTLSIFSGTAPDDNRLTELEVIPYNGGYRLACVSETSVYEPAPHAQNIDRSVVEVVDFTSNGSMIPLSHKKIHMYNGSYPFVHTFIKGLEFSPNGEVLYLTNENTTSYPNSIHYIDLSIVTPVVSSLGVASSTLYKHSIIESDLNGDLFFAHAGGIAKFTNPNTPLSGTFTPNHIPFTLSLSETGTAGYAYSYDHSSYLLPDQIDGEDWNVRFDSVTCCAPVTGGTEDYEVSTGIHNWSTGVGNNPWNASGAVYITGNITIPSGADVTINGMEFFFSEESQINIHVNGKLTIDNTLLSANECRDEMWQGVRVWGSPALPPTLGYQGYFRMQNSSEISYAYIGVANYKTSVNASSMHYPNYLGNEGGRIEVEGSKFINNFKGTVISNYVHTSSSYPFKDCQFITNAQLPHGLNPAIHATVSNSSYVTFLGCDFINSTTGIYADNQRGIGIFSADGKLNVSYLCSNFVIPCAEANRDKSTFKRLYKGVSAVNTLTNRPIGVKFAEFDSVTQGIYLGSVDNAICVDNDFTYIGPTVNSLAYGVYIMTSNQYTIENNSFSGAGNTEASIHGVVVNNTNDGGSENFVNKIYNNDFEDLDYGITGRNENAFIIGENPVEDKGLRFLCNTFSNDEYHDISWAFGGIMPDQGSGIQIAGNEFSYPTPDYGDYWNYNRDLATVAPFDYIYSVDYAHYINTGVYNVIPNDIDSDNTGMSPISGTFNPASHCKTNYFDGRFIFRPKSTSDSYEFEQLAEEAKVMEAELISIDDMVSSLIVNFKSNFISASEFTTGLMNLGPLMNDEALVEVSKMSSQIAHKSIKDIMEYNSPLSPEVLYAVKNSSMPSGVSNTIAQSSATSGSNSARKTKEMMINSKWVESASNRNNLISFYIHDTTITDGVDKVKEIYEKSNDLSDKKLLIDLLISNREGKRAQQLTDSIRGLNDNTEYYAQLVDVLLNPSATDEQKLYAIYEQDTLSRVGRKAYARLMRDYNYPLNVYISYPVRDKSMKFEFIESDYSNGLLSIYPNPSDGVFNIFIDDKENTNGTIQVFDNIGKVVITSQLKSSLGYIEMSSFDKGVYHVVISTENGETYTERVVLK